LLYARGTLTGADERAVALVGSRRCSDYGRRVAARLAAGLARAGVTVVSGLPHTTPLNILLSLPFDACVVEAEARTGLARPTASPPWRPFKQL
jgi:hypothetical protein